MDPAHTIRDAVARVSAIRAEAAGKPDLNSALVAVKALQGRRFAGTYADLLRSDEYGTAARFFLEDLYSDRDYSQRDAQFSRIAGALQRLFPQQVIATAVALAQLHLLTEELDWQMASQWGARGGAPSNGLAAQYVTCWRAVGRDEDRKRQLEIVLTVGKDLDRLTRTPGLRLMLRMMRGPARAAGLGSLQDFLETGFDTFAQMTGKGRSAETFLRAIQTRESTWIERLSHGDAPQCIADLQGCMT
ncbi:MAG: hypothetical protein H7Y28_10930 [Rhodoferax sp.]|nr:hypothetical protein [Rhodoferax sp.]